MKKIFFALLFFSLSSSAFAKLKVVTTLPDLAALAGEVGGDLISVESLARGDQDPHYLEPKPSYVVTMNRADLLIEAGLELEVGWLPTLLTQSRNPKIGRSQPGHLIASQGLAILEIPSGKIDRSMGDVHPNGNPHYWLKPQNGLKIASAIAKRLAELDPPNAAQYERNFQQFEERFKRKIAAWETELKPLRGKTVVTYHKSFSYFADWVGLKVIDEIEPKPGIPPSPAHILSLMDLMKSKGTSMIISENYYDSKPSQFVSEKTGAKILMLPTSVGGEASVKTYEENIRTAT